MQQIILLRCGIAYSSCMSLGPSRGVSSLTWPPFGAAIFLEGKGVWARLFGGGLSAGQSHTRPAHQAGDKTAKPVLAMGKAGGLGHPGLVQIKRAVDFNLEGMHPGFGFSVEIGSVSSGIGCVAGNGKAQFGEGALGIHDQLGRGGLAVAIPYDNVGAARGRWHGMAID